jgi:ankyrin repeat protein
MLTFAFRNPSIHPKSWHRTTQFAARSGQMQTLNYLLSLPTLDATLTDDRGQTALDAARVNDKKEALQALEAYLSSKR